MDPETNRFVDQNPYWEGEDEKNDYCECPGPPLPPQFLVPLPPPPSFLHLCRGEHPDLQYCEVRAGGTEYTHPLFRSLPFIAIVSSVVLVAILVSSFLLWKHRKKVRNFLPCENDHHSRCDIDRSKGVSYDEELINHRPTRLVDHHGSDTQTLTPIELFDIRFGRYIHHHRTSASHTNFPFISKETVSIRSKKSKEQLNLVYEYVSDTSDDNDGSRSCDLDVDESELEVRTLASEDELILGEHPRQCSRPCSETSNRPGSTRRSLCYDMGSASSDGVENKEPQLPCSSHDGSHYLERNKDAYSTRENVTKQNYYKGKNMMGPDLTNPETARDSGTGVDLTPHQFVCHHSSSVVPSPWKNLVSPHNSRNWREGRVSGPCFTILGSRNHIRYHSPPPPPYPAECEMKHLPSVYNPHVILPATAPR